MMATCKDCLHVEVCAYKVKGLFACDRFKDKTKYAEQIYGKWIYDSNYTGKNKNVWICSNCGNRCSLRKNRDGYNGMTNEDMMREYKSYCCTCGSKNEV